MIRETSIAALQKGRDSGRFGVTYAMILDALKRHPHGLTRREIERETGLRPNQVSGRVCEMLDRESVEEFGPCECTVTHNQVMVVKLKTREVS